MTLANKIKLNHPLYSTTLLLIVLPIRELVVPVLILMILSWLLYDSFSQKKSQLKSKPIIWLFVLPFFAYLAGMIYSDNLAFGWKDVELKLSLLIFPIIYGTTTYSFEKHRKTLAIAFIASIICCALISIVQGAISSRKVPTYMELDYFLHPSYLSMFLNLSIVLIIYGIHTVVKKNHKLLLWLSFIAASITIWLSLSKSGIILWGILLFLIMGYFFFIRKEKVILFVTVALTSIVVVLSVVFVPKLKMRFNSLLTSTISSTQSAISEENKNENEIEANETRESTMLRILIWRETIEIIDENLILGTGTGDIKDELFLKYEEANLHRALEKELNVHNQFLQVFATLGLIGFVVFIAAFILPFLTAIRQRNILYLAFLFIFSINLLFESMLEKQDGVIFYAFFNALLFFHFQPKINQQSSSKS